MAYTRVDKPVRDDLTTITASICGVSADYVRKVIRGDRNNDRVFDTYMYLRDGKNNLVKAVEKAVKL